MWKWVKWREMVSPAVWGVLGHFPAPPIRSASSIWKKSVQRFNHKFLSPSAFSTAPSVLCLPVSTDPGFVQTSWPKWLWLEQGQFYVSKCKDRVGPCSSGIVLMLRDKAVCEADLETGRTEASLASSQNFPGCNCKGTDPVHRQVAEHRP